MNNEQQTWILKQPIEAEYRPIDEDCDYERMFVEAFGEAISLDKFNNLFQPLDVSGLTRQVEKQIHKAFIRGYEYGLKTDGEPSEDPTFDYEKLKTTIAEQVVLLFLNQERETK